MKPRIEKLPHAETRSFTCNTLHGGVFDCPYHLHPEYEITYIAQSSGRRIVGDALDDFEPGDLVLIGSNVPHMYINDRRPSSPSEYAMSFVIQFRRDCFGPGFFDLPEMSGINRLLQLSQRGLALDHGLRSDIVARVHRLFTAPPAWRTIGLLEILQTIVENPQFRFLASAGFEPNLSNHDADRINRVVQFVTENLHQEIYLEAAAELVDLTRESFSRFFRRVGKKTFTEFVNELRISRACSLLAQTNLAVTEIASQCGFNNLSNFNKRFLSLKNLTPSEYRKKMAHTQPLIEMAQRPATTGSLERFVPAED